MPSSRGVQIMAAFTWFMLALSWKIVASENTDCDVKVGASCFFARIDRSSRLNYNEAVAYCKSQNAEIATIKSDDIYTLITDKLRAKIEEEKGHIRAWIGITIDSSRNLSPEGSYGNWYPQFPLTSHQRFYDVNVYVVIRPNGDPDYDYQGMVNSNPTRTLPGVICEKIDPCEAVYHIRKDYTFVDVTGNGQSKSILACKALGGSIVYPTTKEHFECMRKAAGGMNDEAWIGIRRLDGSPDYTLPDGSPAPYIQDHLKDPQVTSIPGGKGVFVKFHGDNLPEMAVTDESAEDKLVLCQNLS